MPVVQNPTLPADLESTVERLLQLPEAQRIVIGDRLLESVPPRFHPDTIAEWKRRLQEIDDGIDEGVPAEEAVDLVRRSLRRGQQVTMKGRS